MVEWRGRNVFYQNKKTPFFVGIGVDITKRKEVEQALKESEKKFKDIFELSPLPMAISTIEDGKYKDVNKTFTKILGYTKKEVIGKSSLKLGIFVDKKERKKALDLFKKQGFLNDFEVKVKHKNGEILTMLFSVNFIKNNKEKFLLTQVVNISDRKKFEQMIVEEKNKLQEYLDVADVILLTLDKKQKVVAINKRGCELLGYTKEYVIGKNWFDYFVPKDNLSKVKKIFDNVIRGKTKGVERFENEILTRFGERKMISWHNKLIKDKDGKYSLSLSSGEDITEHKKYEESIKESEKKYSTLVEGSEDTVIVIQNGLIKFVNKNSIKLTGYSPEDVVGKKFLELVAQKYKKIVAERYKKRIKGEKVINRYELDIIAKSGKLITVEINSSFLNFEGKPAVMAIMRDISRAKEIDKMKSEFISVASHQLRGPLTGIKWYSQLLLTKKTGDLTEKQIDFIQQIYNSNERMIRLVNDLLDVSHIETGQKFAILKKTGDVVSLIRNVIKDQKNIFLAKKINVSFTNSCPNKLRFKFDQDKIFQVFSNLINNSIKYSKNNKIIININCLDKEVVFSIKDYGFGIPKKQEGRVFERFFRGDNIATISTEGTGLGLYIAKSIVEAHGGKIWFKSEENSGTTFYFTLPLK